MRKRRAPRRRVIKLDRVRARLYNICMDGSDQHAIQAARVLLLEKGAIEQAETVDADVLAAIHQALQK